MATIPATGGGTEDPSAARQLLIFQVAGQFCALRIESVREIVPMAELVRLPGQPSVLEGFLNLHGAPVAVLRLDRLFDLPAAQLSLYTPLIILKGQRNSTALLVDRVDEIASAPAGAFLPAAENSCFNDCSPAQVVLDGRTIHLLSSEHLLLEKERRAVAELQTRAQRYLDELEGRAE
jgi:chemotaxis signal transduction protein